MILLNLANILTIRAAYGISYYNNLFFLPVDLVFILFQPHKAKNKVLFI